ncbi:hypothetical protein COCSUDRAFT_64271 [Coccomyxa subellipsoidea C-169]|uniref:SWIM-type domain-containing protein n=1 Tax=Coccomyxa subellipsoidea (strain C-169) TaxID=574566 RepID=I0ZA54_COCSC|nr:hypothetical protein COCSUDRAFT_64271 [Coccomyxa subellipsoidea C-169]EIE27523.1 hypothetical protein COCSUDRAFT_64271 [Coccomyxa subellipsoidea C-169]|eukprot:XP_005652067.1 hypothetical protein COCSUDRAFT_64271 [Coccomyxa subellipsoidea C-169]
MGGKRKVQEVDNAGEGDLDHEEEDEFQRDAEGLSFYERQRLELIERNRQRMIAFGIPAAVLALENLAPAAKPKPPRRKKAHKEPRAPTRQSSRLRGEEAHGTASELALFVVNDECPRCSKVLTKGHKQHLEHCTGKPPRPAKYDESDDEDVAEDEEELAEVEVSKEAERIQRLDDKLKSLQMNGLIELTDKAAKFVVLGSTKKHYTVTLSDDRHACQCVDSRIRKHECKHIRLVLTQLDIADNPSKWHEAVEAKVGQVLQNDGASDGALAASPTQPKSKKSVKHKEPPQQEQEIT